MVKNIIGVAYELNAQELAGRIFERIVKVEIEDSNERTCYFCRKKIEGGARVVLFREGDADNRYYLDEFCYKTARSVGNNNNPGVLN